MWAGNKGCRLVFEIYFTRSCRLPSAIFIAAEARASLSRNKTFRARLVFFFCLMGRSGGRMLRLSDLKRLASFGKDLGWHGALMITAMRSSHSPVCAALSQNANLLVKQFLIPALWWRTGLRNRCPLRLANAVQTLLELLPSERCEKSHEQRVFNSPQAWILELKLFALSITSLSFYADFAQRSIFSSQKQCCFPPAAKTPTTSRKWLIALFLGCNCPRSSRLSSRVGWGLLRNSSPNIYRTCDSTFDRRPQSFCITARDGAMASNQASCALGEDDPEFWVFKLHSDLILTSEIFCVESCRIHLKMKEQFFMQKCL